MKIPYAALWWERPKLRDGAAFESVATVEILFQKRALLCILEQCELEKRRQGQRGQAAGYTFATNLQEFLLLGCCFSLPLLAQNVGPGSSK